MSNKIPDVIVNVQSNHTKKVLIFDKVLRDELLAWVNKTLQSKFQKIEELCTGAAYCQLLHAIFPTSISIKRVKFITNLEHECFENYKILQKAFDKLGVKKNVPVSRLCKGKYEDNLDFLVWFRKFYMANDNCRNRFYDPVAIRSGMPMKYGPVEVRRIYEKRAAEALKATITMQPKMIVPPRDVDKSVQKTKQSFTPTKSITSSHSLKRSATRTLIKHRRSSAGSIRERKSDSSRHTRRSSRSSSAPDKKSFHIHSDFSDASANPSIKLKGSATRTVIKANKATDEIVSVQFPSPATSEGSEIQRQKAATEKELAQLRNKVFDLERNLETKTRHAFELELTLTKTQNEINEMEINLRRARQERDIYFDKIRKVTMCCRTAQCNAELCIPVSEVMKIFLADSLFL